MTTRELVRSTQTKVERVANVVRRIIGVPDYDRYVAHCRLHHPEQAPMSQAEFERMRMNDRYSRPGARCC